MAAPVGPKKVHPPVHALEVEEGLSRRKAQAGGRGRRFELAESLAGAQAGRGEAGTAAPGPAAGGEGCSAHAGALP